jgi:hypothetical protein
LMDFEHYVCLDRDVYLTALPSLSDWPTEGLPCPTAFCVLLVMDATSVPDAAMRSSWRTAFRQDARNACFWGPHCERMHDAFDRATVELDNERPGEEHFVQTAWHSKEPLDTALWFFVWNVVPLPDDEGHAGILIVTWPECLDHVRSRLADPLGPWIDDV